MYLPLATIIRKVKPVSQPKNNSTTAEIALHLDSRFANGREILMSHEFRHDRSLLSERPFSAFALTLFSGQFDSSMNPRV